MIKYFVEFMVVACIQDALAMQGIRYRKLKATLGISNRRCPDNLWKFRMDIKMMD